MNINKRYKAALRKLIDMEDFDHLKSKEIADDYVTIIVERGYNIETFTFYDSGTITIDIKKGKQTVIGNGVQQMTKINAPCYQCEERHIDCHSSCEKYIAYANERKEISRKRIEEFDMQSQKWESMKRMKNRRRSK